MTFSHGITPSVCLLRCSPQEKLPAEFGDLTITDGNETVVFPACKLQAIKIEKDDRGFVWILEILDRRWRWNFGVINGSYNQMTPFGRLIPWTIRSPKELAQLCLEAMGEQNYDISNLPNGIAYPGPEYPNPVINVSGVNPPVDWDGVPPAQALQQLADRCGCRIIYRWKTDDVLVTPVGRGNAVPAGSIAKSLPSLVAPLAPSGVGVIGSPTRYQCRLALTAVGKEWDGSYWPINLLSYAPQVTTPAKPQIDTITFKDFGGSGVVSVSVTLTDTEGNPHKIGFNVGATDAATATNCALEINVASAGGDVEWEKVTASASSNVVTVEALEPETPFN